MNNRLLEIIKYKTGGRQTDFAVLMGWTPQYLAKLLRGENFGIKPVVTLLEKLPEISGRWLLLGQGDMLEIGKLFNLQREAFAQVQAILEIEKYIPVKRCSKESRERKISAQFHHFHRARENLYFLAGIYCRYTCTYCEVPDKDCCDKEFPWL